MMHAADFKAFLVTELRKCVVGSSIAVHHDTDWMCGVVHVGLGFIYLHAIEIGWLTIVGVTLSGNAMDQSYWGEGAHSNIRVA